ncbi:signal peptidase I [Streptococcus cuniculipharyngis]|uniref:Signal peptidase I n=1 Tax=Streptococcus cuniculipharyngis TaxID=1562651 RepID=A0A5C5SEJ7_9STRE|nr:signal peptidase I [Streptococcus cuniculipharyngis]TWS98201.1 signal peptidase I [Streptococcus cuniculipharyngis]
MKTVKYFLKEWGFFTLFLSLFFLSWIFVWVNVKVEGHSMDPTLQDGQRLFVLKVTPIDRFDIVVAKEGDKSIVKRVIGMPGDTISYNNDQLTINGKEVKEDYLQTYQTAFKQDKLQATYAYNSFFQQLASQASAFTTDSSGSPNFTVKVPENQYYLLGDDRLVSKDSRAVGTFSRQQIVGEVSFRFWPFSAIGKVK